MKFKILRKSYEKFANLSILELYNLEKIQTSDLTYLNNYYNITNNPGNWEGESNTNIKTATGGELFKRDGTKTGAKTASTSATVTGETLNISTTTNATKGVLNGSMYIQYYINILLIFQSILTILYNDI